MCAVVFVACCCRDSSIRTYLLSHAQLPSLHTFAVAWVQAAQGQSSVSGRPASLLPYQCLQQEQKEEEPRRPTQAMAHNARRQGGQASEERGVERGEEVGWAISVGHATHAPTRHGRRSTPCTHAHPLLPLIMRWMLSVVAAVRDAARVGVFAVVDPLVQLAIPAADLSAETAWYAKWLVGSGSQLGGCSICLRSYASSASSHRFNFSCA